MSTQQLTAKRIVRLYSLAIAGIALLVLMSQGFLQTYLYSLSFDSREINLAGKMRMLTQRTVKLGLLVQRGDRPEKHIGELRDATQELFDIFDALARGDATLRVQAPPNAHARALFESARPLLATSLRAADQLLTTASDAPAFEQNLNILVSNDDALLAAIAAIPAYYDDVAKRDVQRLEWIEIGIAVATLLLLLIELRFIFRPMVGIALNAIARVEADAAEAGRLRRLAATGEMSGGIAHELNSPLTALSFSIQRLQRRIKRSKPVSEEELAHQLDRMAADALRLSHIVQSVRALAAGTLPESKRNQDAIALLEEAIDHFHTRYGFRDLPISLQHLDQPIIVSAVDYQLEQVIINLLKNAADAVEPLPDRWIEISVATTVSGVTIAVRDAGKGIPKPAAERIFDPFFSTKETRDGMGLGLALCQKLIELHGGELDYKLIDDHTAFVISLPSSAPETSINKDSDLPSQDLAS